VHRRNEYTTKRQVYRKSTKEGDRSLSLPALWIYKSYFFAWEVSLRFSIPKQGCDQTIVIGILRDRAYKTSVLEDCDWFSARVHYICCPIWCFSDRISQYRLVSITNL